MRRISAALAALAVAVLGTFAVASAASAATSDEPFPVESDCNEGWYTNPDEGHRLPEQTEDGLFFEPADLVHHAAGFALTELGAGGTFVADPAPDGNFRFSVEIINVTPIDGKSGYATLHWDGSAWFIGGADSSQGQYEGHEADAENFIGKMGRFGEISADSTVISFGVGYTQTPPGTVETTISSVTFNGTTYDLTCKPEPVDTETTSEETTSKPALPVTGSSLTTVVIVGVVLLAIGAGALVIARRRRA